jgi:ABC-2 type transport system permease protein
MTHASAQRNRRSNGTLTWWVVALKELAELWQSGKAPALLFAFCVVQGALVYFKVSDITDPTPPKELIYFILMNAIAVGVFMSVVIGADSISGERERATLEALLVTPVSRRQILVGKFIAALSPWTGTLVVTIPLVVLIGHGDDGLGSAILWGSFAGTLLSGSFAALGMLVSFWSTSNSKSLFISLVMYFTFLFPTWLPGGAQAGIFGRMLKRANPMESIGHWLEKVVVNNRPALEYSTDPRGGGWLWLLSPAVLALLLSGVLFLHSANRLTLEVTGARARGVRRGRIVSTVPERGPAITEQVPMADGTTAWP